MTEQPTLQFLVTGTSTDPRLLTPEETAKILAAAIAEGAAADRSRLFTVDDVADRLQISRAEVYRLQKAGELKTVHIGRLVRVSAAALAEYIEALDGGSA
jgi:excisionase family DNA binding protein